MLREIPEIQRNIREFFPSISMHEDCGMMKAILPLYLKAVPQRYLPVALRHKADIEKLYATSLLTDSTRLEKFLAGKEREGRGETPAIRWQSYAEALRW